MHGLASAVLRMPWRTQLQALRVVVVALVVEIGLRAVSLPRLARVLGVGLETASAPAAPSGELPESLATEARRRELEAVGRVMRHWPAERICLRRALVLGRLLRDLQPQLRVGVAREDGVLVAHAWIEVAGVRLDQGEDRFVPLSRPPRSGRRTTPK